MQIPPVTTKRQFHIQEAANSGFVVNEMNDDRFMTSKLLAAVSGPRDLIELIAYEYSVRVFFEREEKAPPTWTPAPSEIWPFLPDTELVVIWKSGEQTYPQPFECFERDWKDVAFFRITKGEWSFKP